MSGVRRVLRVPNAHVGRGARTPGAVPHAGIQEVGEAVPLVFTDELSEDNESSMSQSEKNKNEKNKK